MRGRAAQKRMAGAAMNCRAISGHRPRRWRHPGRCGTASPAPALAIPRSCPVCPFGSLATQRATTATQAGKHDDAAGEATRCGRGLHHAACPLLGVTEPRKTLARMWIQGDAGAKGPFQLGMRVGGARTLMISGFALDTLHMSRLSSLFGASQNTHRSVFNARFAEMARIGRE